VAIFDERKTRKIFLAQHSEICSVENQGKWRSRPLKIKKIPAARPTMVGTQQVTLAYGFPPGT
tara:strand:- start:23 stop:211 length:189 start_codon:yes stop_codon:yes gene_type:complete